MSGTMLFIVTLFGGAAAFGVSGNPVVCGPGTELDNWSGMCRPSSSACGPGTELQNSVCVPSAQYSTTGVPCSKDDDCAGCDLVVVTTRLGSEGHNDPYGYLETAPVTKFDHNPCMWIQAPTNFEETTRYTKSGANDLGYYADGLCGHSLDVVFGSPPLSQIPNLSKWITNPQAYNLSFWLSGPERWDSWKSVCLSTRNLNSRGAPTMVYSPSSPPPPSPSTPCGGCACYTKFSPRTSSSTPVSVTYMTTSGMTTTLSVVGNAFHSLPSDAQATCASGTATTTGNFYYYGETAVETDNGCYWHATPTASASYKCEP